VGLRNGLYFLMTAVEHGLAGVIGKMQPLKRDKKKNNGKERTMTEQKELKSKDKSLDRRFKIKDTQSLIKLKPFNWTLASQSTTGSSNDMVNHPPHYASSKIECIDAMEAMTSQNREFKTVLDGHQMYCWQVIFKYIWRFPFKHNAVEDLKKAQFYLQRLINSLETKK